MLGYETALQGVDSRDLIEEQTEACQEGLAKVSDWRLHSPLECLEFGNKQSFLGRDQPWVRDRHRVGEASGATCPKHNPPLITRKVSMCCAFQKALLGSPANHSPCTLRREIWAVSNSLLPALCWAQTFASALLLVHQANALGGLFCLGMGACEQLAKQSHIPPTPMCYRGQNLAEMFIFLTPCKTWPSPAFWGLSCTNQLQVARGQITTASFQIFGLIPIPKSLQTFFPWVFHEMKLNTSKAVKRKKNKKKPQTKINII